MTQTSSPAALDICADPFRERRRRARRITLQLLGARFEFETGSAQLMRLIEQAYAGLPSHRLTGSVPRLGVTLLQSGGAGGGSEREPALPEMSSGAGFLYCAAPGTSMTVISPAQRSALVVIGRELLRFHYHARYELIEFAVFTLAARVQGLMPLHAACVGGSGRGLLLLGASGAGKSTAILHCGLAGMDLVSEDSLFVTPDSLVATGVANFLHIRRESLSLVPAREAAALGRSPVIRRRSGIEKLEIDLRHPRFRLAPRPVRLVGVVELSPCPAEAGGPLIRLDSRRLLARLRDSQPYAAGLEGWRTFSRAVRRLPAFELRRGRHPGETVAALRQLLREGARGG